MRLQGKSTPDALYAHTTQATMFGHRTDTPVGGLAWGRLQCQCDHPLNFRVVNGAWSSGTRLIEQSIEALGNKPAAPFSHALFGHSHLFSHRRVCLGTRTQKNDTRPVAPRPAPSSVVVPIAPMFHVPRGSRSRLESDVQFACQFSF